MSTATEILTNREYKYGFVTDIESDTIPKGLSEDTVRLISAKKNEPEWMLEFRLKAYRGWLKMDEPSAWPNFEYPKIDFQNISYYSAPKQKPTKASMDEGRSGIGSARSRSSAFRSASKNSLQTWRSMRCSIRFRSRRLIKRS
jgi:hypothetical protein